MSNIASYPIITPKGGDLIVGSETYDATAATPIKGNPTRNFSVSSVVSTQIPSYVIGTTNKIPVFTGSNKIQDSIMTETAAGGSFTGKYISVTAAGGGLSTQKLEVNKALIDGAGSTGTDGFLLSSTTVGGDKEVAWINTSTFLSSYLPLAGGTMSGGIVMDTNKITGLGDPTSAQDAGTKAYIDAADALKLNLSGGTMSGPLVFSQVDSSIAMGTNSGSGIISNENASSSIQIYGPDAANYDGEIHIESADEMNFSTNAVQRLRIKSDGQIDIITGPLEIEAGNLILEAGDLQLPANKGIYFGGNTTSAYELDYYQEGTFALAQGGNWENVPDEISGMYTRIGNKVTINVKFKGGDMTTRGNGYLVGLPFAPKPGSVTTELFTGSIMGDNYDSFGIAAVKYNTNAASSRIYFSAISFSVVDQHHFFTITYLMAT